MDCKNNEFFYNNNPQYLFFIHSAVKKPPDAVEELWKRQNCVPHSRSCIEH